MLSRKTCDSYRIGTERLPKSALGLISADDRPHGSAEIPIGYGLALWTGVGCPFTGFRDLVSGCGGEWR